MDKFIPKSALVDALGISSRTLETWCVHRNFPKARRLPGSRLVFYCISEVDSWLEQALETETSE